MRRRQFIGLLGWAATGLPAPVLAQDSDKVARIGVLGPSPDNPVSAPAYKVFLSELQKLGFTEGKNLSSEYRSTDDGESKAFIAANELVAAKVDLLVADGPELPLKAASQARPAVPIVMLANNFDPIARGYIKSLVQPGGIITGLVSRQPELAAKQLELLVEAFPDKPRLGVLWDAASTDQFNSAERVAKSMNLSVVAHKMENPPYDFGAAFQAIAKDGAQMLQVLSSPQFTAQRGRIAELAIQYRLPTMFIYRQYVEAGGLMSYGVDNTQMWRRAAALAAKILRGASPADLPVEQVTTFEFAVNLKTAKAIGVDLPTSILLRANEVIE
jgi:putative ABC transport system substrate-binding protein